MHTDKPFYQIFQTCPRWLFQLVGQPIPACDLSFSSVEFKALAKTADGLLEPADPREPLWLVEFQTKLTARAALTASIEVGMLEDQRYPRPARGIVIYLGAVPADCARWPWVKCYDLHDLLPQLEGDHLLKHILSPLLVATDDELAARAEEDYHAVEKNPALTPEQCSKLCDVLYDLLVQRFTHLTTKEIHTMLNFGDIKHTVLGQDLISIGREEGIMATLLRQATRRFGALPEGIRSQIDDLNYLQLEDLADALLDFGSRSDLETWLSKLPLPTKG
jgi:predicted transposase YdaD